MKIILQLSNDQIKATLNVLKIIEDAQPTVDAGQKLYRSMLWEAYDKFTAFKRKIVKQDTLFDQQKKRKVILKYYEAHALHHFLKDLEVIDDDYFKNMLLQIVTQLDKALA